MPVSVTIRDTSGTRRTLASITLGGIDDSITLRDLVRTRVREEVARYNAAQGAYFVGDRQLRLTADSDICFIRLLQLAGG